MTSELYYGEDYKKLPVYSRKSGQGYEVRPDVYMFTDQIANVTFIGHPEDPNFVLVDTGMPKRADIIIEAAKERFGENARAEAIILTHGHFDHVGGVIELIEEWDAPVYAHPLEVPFLMGGESYPKPDATVEGGMVAKMSPVFPTDPIYLGDHLHPLEVHGVVPHLPEFEWIHVPGHTPGQVALYRKRDGVLLSADTFVTTNQENFFDVVMQNVEFSGPPRYLTPDWDAAKESVLKLQRLNAQVVIAGHGQPVEGEELREGLDELIRNWDEDALPDHGRYVDEED